MHVYSMHISIVAKHEHLQYMCSQMTPEWLDYTQYMDVIVYVSVSNQTVKTLAAAASELKTQ